jgi:hypothetical protein
MRGKGQGRQKKGMIGGPHMSSRERERDAAVASGLRCWAGSAGLSGPKCEIRVLASPPPRVEGPP